MPRPKLKDLRLLAALALLALPGGGCSKEIGDSCSLNVDCDPLGERICDTSQVEGYCTIAGCDRWSCPEEAVCIRFFPTQFLSQACDPETEDAADPAILDVSGSCPAGERCVTDQCSPEEVCLSSGLCAGFTLERRYCMKTCDADDDCRPGYECRMTGTRGAEVLPDPDAEVIHQVGFCAQQI